MGELLSIQELRVCHSGDGAASPVLRDLSLDLRAGEAVGIRGTSGSGKTTLTRAILRLLPPQTVVKGRIELQGKDLLQLAIGEMRRIRGRQICLISQEPSAALNPFVKARAQVEEVRRAHGRTGGEVDDATAVLGRFFGADAERIANAYPHELSGGERQRLVICQAIVSKPALLIADEPTVALDSVSQKAFLDLLRELRESTGLSLLLVSHHRSVLRYVTDRCVELADGRLQ